MSLFDMLLTLGCGVLFGFLLGLRARRQVLDRRLARLGTWEECQDVLRSFDPRKTVHVMNVGKILYVDYERGQIVRQRFPHEGRHV